MNVRAEVRWIVGVAAVVEDDDIFQAAANQLVGTGTSTAPSSATTGDAAAYLMLYYIYDCSTKFSELHEEKITAASGFRYALVTDIPAFFPPSIRT